MRNAMRNKQALSEMPSPIQKETEKRSGQIIQGAPVGETLISSPLKETQSQLAPLVDELPAAFSVSWWERVKKLGKRKRVITVLIVIAVSFGLFRTTLFAPLPPEPDVVATFKGGQITIADVEEHVAQLVPDKSAQEQLKTVAGYRAMAAEMAEDEVVRQWAAERKVEQDEGIAHVMQHITEEINLEELHANMHEDNLGVAEGDVLAYYEANRQDFGEKTFTEVQDEIREILSAKNEDRFVENYITGLKNKASITRDYELLAVSGPTDRELVDYYNGNQDTYRLSAQVRVQEIVVSAGSDEKKAQEDADKTWLRVNSGENFGTVAEQLSPESFQSNGVTIVSGQRESTFEDVVFNLEEGQISPVFRVGDNFYVVKVLQKMSERVSTYVEVRTRVRSAVMAEKEQVWFDQRSNQTLLTIDGNRYTVGEFWKEYQELPPTFLAQYQGAQGRQDLAEQLIERLLLLKDSTDKSFGGENNEKLEEVRLDFLVKILEQEEIDDKIDITDEEIQRFYDQHQAELVLPPKSKIRQISIRLGETEDEQKRAREKAQEAYKKLVPGLLKKGVGFAQIAAEYSEDEATKANGGEVAELVGEGVDFFSELTEHGLHQYILSIPEGGIGRPFEWSDNIYIISVISRATPELLILDEAKELIREQLELQKHEELRAQLSDDLMEKMQLTIYDRTLKRLAQKE